MKMLNPRAPDFVPIGLKEAFSPKAAGGAHANGSIAISAAVGGLVNSKLLIIKTSNPGDAGLPTPNGLAELATQLSVSDSMSFEDILFDHGSRRGSVRTKQQTV